jgi:hypothetical protein
MPGKQRRCLDKQRQEKGVLSQQLGGIYIFCSPSTNGELPHVRPYTYAPTCDHIFRTLNPRFRWHHLICPRSTDLGYSLHLGRRFIDSLQLAAYIGIWLPGITELISL